MYTLSEGSNAILFATYFTIGEVLSDPDGAFGIA